MSAGDAEHEASWAACRAATLALERRLNESYHPGDADAVSTAVSAASAARTAMLRGMGEVARFEWDRQECVALLLNMRRTLQANWDSADPQKRAAMGPLCAAVAAALTHAPFAPPPEAAIIGAIDTRQRTLPAPQPRPAQKPAPASPQSTQQQQHTSSPTTTTSEQQQPRRQSRTMTVAGEAPYSGPLATAAEAPVLKRASSEAPAGTQQQQTTTTKRLSDSSGGATPARPVAGRGAAAAPATPVSAAAASAGRGRPAAAAAATPTVAVSQHKQSASETSQVPMTPSMIVAAQRAAAAAAAAAAQEAPAVMQGDGEREVVRPTRVRFGTLGASGAPRPKPPPNPSRPQPKGMTPRKPVEARTALVAELSSQVKKHPSPAEPSPTDKPKDKDKDKDKEKEKEKDKDKDKDKERSSGFFGLFGRKKPKEGDESEASASVSVGKPVRQPQQPPPAAAPALPPKPDAVEEPVSAAHVSPTAAPEHTLHPTQLARRPSTQSISPAAASPATVSPGVGEGSPALMPDTASKRESSGSDTSKRSSTGSMGSQDSVGDRRRSGAQTPTTTATATTATAVDGSGEKKDDKPVVVVVPTRALSTASTPGEAPKSKREHIEREILVSEQSYVEGLRVMIEIYEAPLRACEPSIVSDDDINALFSNARTIYSFNMELLKALSSKAEPIGKVFVRLTPFFKSYTLYSKTFDEASQTLQRLKKSSSDFRKFLERQAKLHSDVNTIDLLDALLITPIQRIPRYNLLLIDLIRNTDEAHPDLPNLKKALDLMKEVAEAVDGSIKFSENINKLMRIQQLMTFNDGEHLNLVLPHRQFVREGDVTLLAARGKKMHAHLFLFNDSIVIAKRKRMGKLIFKLHVQLETCSAEEVPTQDESDAQQQQRFMLQTPRARYTVIVPKDDECEAWVSDINTNRDKQMEREGMKMFARLKQKSEQRTAVADETPRSSSSAAVEVAPTPPSTTPPPSSQQQQQQQQQPTTAAESPVSTAAPPVVTATSPTPEPAAEVVEESPLATPPVSAESPASPSSDATATPEQPCDESQPAAESKPSAAP